MIILTKMTEAPKLTIEKLITIDKSGMPKAPSLRQLIDKDVRELYIRDRTDTKEIYIKECIVIYYLGDPKSPAKQKGLSYNECLKEAIKQADLPKNYSPDLLVVRLIKRYYEENIGVAGKAVEVLLQAIHNLTIAAGKLNELLNEKLKAAVELEEVNTIVSLMGSVNKQTNDIPEMTKKLKIAQENLRNETETIVGRGGITVRASMSADDDDD